MDLLPNEVLLEIFEFCKVLPLTLVCKKFNEIVSNSPALMRKITFNISDKSETILLNKSARKHQNFCFRFNYNINDRFAAIFKVFEIKSLELVRCIIPADVVQMLLVSSPQLESLSIHATYLKNFEDHISNFEAPRMAKLKKLNLRNSDFGFLEFLTNSPIERLSLLPPIENLPVSTINFLKSQPNIKSIDCLHVSVVDDKLLTLMTQELKCLRRLHLEADCVDMTLVRSLNLRNVSVEYLNICNSTEEPGDYNLLLSFFKNVRSLEIEMNSRLEAASMVQIQQQFPKLESLLITHCSGDYFSYIQFNYLKNLVLTTGSQTSDEWTRFARRNPTIESIVIKDESIVDEHFRTICLEFRNLKRLEIYYDPQRLTPEILNFICSSLFPANIKFLKIVQRVSPGQIFLALTEHHKRLLNNNLGFHCILN